MVPLPLLTCLPLLTWYLPLLLPLLPQSVEAGVPLPLEVGESWTVEEEGGREVVVTHVSGEPRTWVEHLDAWLWAIGIGRPKQQQQQEQQQEEEQQQQQQQ